jgi:hypothetical protein
MATVTWSAPEFLDHLRDDLGLAEGGAADGDLVRLGGEDA